MLCGPSLSGSIAVIVTTGADEPAAGVKVNQLRNILFCWIIIATTDEKKQTASTNKFFKVFSMFKTLMQQCCKIMLFN
jgi:hypothetical protein